MNSITSYPEATAYVQTAIRQLREGFGAAVENGDVYDVKVNNVDVRGQNQVDVTRNQLTINVSLALQIEPKV